MQPVRDPYSVLGVAPTASQLQIRKAYRERLRCCHPDLAVVDGDRDELQTVMAAYRVIGHPARRRIYDNERLKLIAAFMAPGAHGPFVSWKSGRIEPTAERTSTRRP